MKIRIFLFAILAIFTNISLLAETWKFRTQDFDEVKFSEWKEDNLNKYSGSYEYEYGDSYGTIFLRAYLEDTKGQNLYAFVCLIEPTEILSEPMVKIFKKLKLDGSSLIDDKNKIVFSFVNFNVDGKVINCIRREDMVYEVK